MSARARLRVPAATGAALAGASLVLTAHNVRRLRRPPPAPPPLTEPVAVLVPARDEVGRIERCLAGLRDALDHGPPSRAPVRVLVLDDESTDATAAVVRAVAAADPRFALVTGRPAPAGWRPKPWACHQLAAAAPADASVLIFVDADVEVTAHALAGTVAMLRAAGLDLVSPHPRQVAVDAAERLVQPLLAWSWLSLLPLRLAERSRRPSLAVANGQILAVDAAAYRRAGGHRAARSAVLDDLALARAVKRAGGRGVVADGTDLASCRMYTGWREVREGYTKSLWEAGGPVATAAVGGALVLAYLVPPLAALTGSRVGAAGYLAAVASRMLAAHRTGARVLDAFGHPLSMVALGALAVDSRIRRRLDTLTWRGRPVAGSAASVDTGRVVA